MKKISLFLLLMVCAFFVLAQAPKKFTYQAVVRNASNQLVTNSMVGVRISILQNSASGNAVYTETQILNTNANGLVTLNIGEGNVVYGSLSNVNWGSGVYFLKSEIDPDGGSNYTVSSMQQLMSVPYALYANEAGNGFSGDYNDLTNLPQIPQIPANVSYFNNDAGYITVDSVPAIPTNVSEFNNDAGYLTSYTEAQTLADVTALGNSAGNRQLKNVSSPTDDYDAVNKLYINQLTDSMTTTIQLMHQQWETALQQQQQIFQQQVQTLQETQQQMQQQIDSLNSILNPVIPYSPEPENFVCGSSQLTDIEGNVYNTIRLGNQCWTTENLRTKHFRDGSELSTSTGSSTSIPYYYQPTETSNYVSGIPFQNYTFETYGLYYNWVAVADQRGLCPDGWHVPTDAQWDTLFTYVRSIDAYCCGGSPNNIAKVLASASGWVETTSPNYPCYVGYVQQSNNATGFNALPAGSWSNNSFRSEGYQAAFWSSTPDNNFTDRGFYRCLDYNATFVRHYSSGNSGWAGLNIRCLRDTLPADHGETSCTPWNTSVTNATACGTYEWHGETYTQSGIYLYGCTGADGTNSMEALNLTILGSDTTHLQAEACDNYMWNGVTYTESGDYFQNLTNIAGCDSVIILHLTVYEGTQNIEADTACGSFEWHDTTYTESGTYIFGYINENGCESADTLHLTIISCGGDTPLDGQPCPGTPTLTDYEGNVYNTVQIGNQCWMRENLRSTQYADGTVIQKITYAGTGYATASTVTPYRYAPQNNEDNVPVYGYLYNLAAVMHGATPSNANPSGVQGICPMGWHVPSNAEWIQLAEYVSSQGDYICGDDNDNIAKSLVDTINWLADDSDSCNVGYSPSSNNTTGFSALPAGTFNTVGPLVFNRRALFWTTTEEDTTFHVERGFFHNTAVMVYNINYKDKANSVRCVRD